jgi:ABC-2 type transport system ATP-binding protein
VTRPAAAGVTAVVRTTGLLKRYGPLTAVDGIDLDVRAGDRYGFLGANGSGKTTTIRMLLGLVHPTAGQIELLGTSRLADALRRWVPWWSSRRATGTCRAHQPAPARRLGRGGPRRTRDKRIEDALELVGLGWVDRRPVRAYSLGMRQRLGLAAALLRGPRLLVLDEPTNGLDPQGIREIRELLMRLNQEGTTIFVSSHLLSEVATLCTRIGVMDRGRLVLQDQLDVLGGPTGRIEVRTPDAAQAAALLGRGVVARDGARLLVTGRDPAALNAELVGAGVRVEHLAAERHELEDVVLAAAGAAGERAGAA